MEEEIKSEIERAQSLIDNLEDNNAVKISLYTSDGRCIDYWWNNNSLLKSAILSELRELKLEILDM